MTRPVGNKPDPDRKPPAPSKGNPRPPVRPTTGGPPARPTKHGNKPTPSIGRPGKPITGSPSRPTRPGNKPTSSPTKPGPGRPGGPPNRPNTTR